VYFIYHFSRSNKAIKFTFFFLLVAEIIPHCEDDLLLYFPYEDHYNDVTCHHAIATQYGDGVSLQYDAERQGNVACFTGETHFEVNVIYKCLLTFAPIQYDKCNVVSS